MIRHEKYKHTRIERISNQGGYMKKVIVLVAVVTSLSAAGVFASGLAIPEQGAAAMGMAAAMTARNEDLSALYYNPAGIDYVENFEVMIGLTPILPSHDFTPFSTDRSFVDPAESKSNIYLPPQIYAAWRASQSVVLGLAVNTPYGLGTEWDETWNGRYTSTFAEIQSININPTVAYQVNEKVSLGVGASYISSSATIEKMVDTGSSLFSAMGNNPALSSIVANTDYDSKFALDGDGSGYAWNLGVMYYHDQNTQFGLSFRSAYQIDYEGTAKFTHKEQAIRQTVWNATAASLQGSGMTEAEITATADATADAAYQNIATSMPAEQDGDATMHMPWSLNLGMKYQASPTWDWSVDVDVVGWEEYEELVIDFSDDKPYDKLVQAKNWENSYIIRAATSYDLLSNLKGRLGIMYDFAPVPDETFDGQLPDSNRLAISCGLGYTIGKIRFDASYLVLKFTHAEKNNGVGFTVDTTGDGKIDRFDVPDQYPVGNGNYESLAHLFSLSASISF